MRIAPLTAFAAIAGIAVAPASLAGSHDPTAWTTERSVPQVVALLRGFAAGDGRHVQDEVAVDPARIVTLRLCEGGQAGEGDGSCERIIVVGTAEVTDVILIPEGPAALPRPAGAGRGGATGSASLFESIERSHIRPGDHRLICGEDGCP